MKNYLGLDIPEYRVTLDDALSSIDFYAEEFTKNGILIFKEMNLTEDDQLLLLSTLGDILGWFPNSQNKFHGKYIEDHTELLNKYKSSGQPNTPDEIILAYHLECTNYEVPQVASAWNMTKFDCDSYSGKTSFIDSRIVFNKLTNKEISFLYNCLIAHIHSGVIEEGKFIHPHEAISKHPLYDYDCLRIDAKGPKYQKLHKFKGKDPGTINNIRYKRLVYKIHDTIKELSNSECYWHSWSKGDVVIPDLNVMYHAVRGGFTYGQREFVGFWAFPESEKSMQQFENDMHILCN